MDLFSELQGLMIRHCFRPDKKAAQHFVVDHELIAKLVSLARLKQSDVVLEIGPGAGFLTRQLLQKCGVVAVELDENLCSLLAREMPKKGFALISGDFLEAELPPFNKIVSLPPYSRSSAIMNRLLLLDFDSAVLVFQREFAEKLVALPGFGQFVALSVLVQQFFDVRIEGSVPSKSFFPRPREESSIVALKAKKQAARIDREKFAFFVKTLFRFRNKNLKNALEKSRQFLLPELKISEKQFKARASKLRLLDEKVDLLPVHEFVSAFKKITG